LPLDPYATASALKYRTTTGGYVLYSVGPNGKDDGGVPLGKGSTFECCSNIEESASTTGDITATPDGLTPLPKN
jgi:hypothetical protein